MDLKKLQQLPEIVILTVLLMVGAVFFMFTNPRSVPSVVLIVGFAMIFAVLYVGLRLIIRLLGLRDRMSAAQYKVLTLGGAGLPVLLLALQSIGQLTLRDVVTIAALFLVGSFYAMKLAPK